MAGFKADRTAEDLKRELSDIMRSLKDPRITGMLSIVRLDLSGDQSYCKVYISSLEGLEKAKEAVKGLKNAEGFIKHEINGRMKLRKLPHFQFIADDSIAHSAEISKTLHELMKE